MIGGWEPCLTLYWMYHKGTKKNKNILGIFHGFMVNDVSQNKVYGKGRKDVSQSRGCKKTCVFFFFFSSLFQTVMNIE